MYDILFRRLILRLLFFDATTDAMTVLFVSKHCSYAKRWEGGHSSKGLIGWKLLPVFTLPNSCPFASKLELCVPKIVESGAKSLRDDFCKYSRLLYFFKTLDFETHSSNQIGHNLWQKNTVGWHRKNNVQNQFILEVSLDWEFIRGFKSCFALSNSWFVSDLILYKCIFGFNCLNVSPNRGLKRIH